MAGGAGGGDCCLLLILAKMANMAGVGLLSDESRDAGGSRFVSDFFLAFRLVPVLSLLLLSGVTLTRRVALKIFDVNLITLAKEFITKKCTFDW